MNLRKNFISVLLAAVLILPQSVYASDLTVETAAVPVAEVTDSVVDDQPIDVSRDESVTNLPADDSADSGLSGLSDISDLETIPDESGEIADTTEKDDKVSNKIIHDSASEGEYEDTEEQEVTVVKSDEIVADLSEAELSEEDPEDEDIIGESGPVDDAELETGVYFIVTNRNRSLALGSEGNSETSGANIEVIKKNNSVKQKWVITALGNGKYSIWNYSSGMALGVAGIIPKNNRNIAQYHRNYKSVKHYYIRKGKKGCVYIQVVGSSLVLGAESTSTDPGDNIRLTTYSGQEEAVWRMYRAATTKPVAGTYVIRSKLDDSKYISVEGSSKRSLAKSVLSSSSARLMTLYSCADGGKFMIHPVCSNYTLTALGTIKSGTAIKQFTVASVNRSMWTFRDEGNGYYSIRSATNSELTIDITAGQSDEGTPVQLYKYNGTDSQLFSLEKIDGNRKIPNGYYAVKSMLNPKMCLDIANNSKNSGANLQLGRYNDRNRQKFYLAYDGNGYYQIRNARSVLNLDVAGASSANGTNVAQYTPNSTKAQKWKPIGNSGVFYFKSAVGNVAMDVSAASTAVGTNIQVYAVNRTNAQKFTLVPVKKQIEKDYIVAIDAGHQRHQNKGKEPIGPGATIYKQKVSSGTEGRWSGLEEYVLNLQVALKLQTELENRGYSVYMIRTTHDVDISNAERAQMAASAGADIFIRIHANGADSSSVRGALNYMPSSSNPYLSASVIEGSQRLSRILLDSYCASTGLPNLGLLTGDDMTGINWAKMPVTIVEMGFMSNRTDDLYMASAAGQAAIVQGLANGVDQYFAP